MEPLGPCCPACGSKVKLPRGAPLPPPQTRVKCPSCGTVGELEAFVRAAAGVADSGSGDAVVDPDPPPAETLPNMPARHFDDPPTNEEGSNPSGSATHPVKSGASASAPESSSAEPVSHQVNADPSARHVSQQSERHAKASRSATSVEEQTAPSGEDLRTRISGGGHSLDLPAGLRCTLTVLSGPDSGKKLSLTQPRVLVGRDNGDFPLSDKEVSREHCAFEITGVTCTVKDLGSRNGTWIDGQRVQSHQLSNVGEVMVGNTTLLFTMTLEDGVLEG